MAHPSTPLTTHADSSRDPVFAEALCGATAATTSTGSVRITQPGRAVDCVVCREMMGAGE